jgi:hypothetical protein
MSPEHKSRDVELRGGIFMVGGIGKVGRQSRESGEASGPFSISHWMCRHGAEDEELR